MRWRLRGRRSPRDGGNAELDARLSETWEAAAAAVGKTLDLPAGKVAILANSGLLQDGAAEPAGMTRQVARQRRRRLALRSAAAAAAALTAGAVALVAVGVPGARRGGTEGPGVLAADVVKRVSRALSVADPSEIAQMTVTTRGAVPGGTTGAATAEEWSYGDRWRAVTHSPAGHLVDDEGVSAGSVYTLVSYPTRTWARQRGLGHPAKLAPGPRSCAPVVAALPTLFAPGLPGTAFSAGSGPATVARALRAAISCGTLAAAGRQRVDGIGAIKLTSPPDSLIPETIWVSPGTYLPVRVVIHPVPSQPALWQTADITWLPATAQNLAKLTVLIPAGFRQVPLTQAVTPIMRHARHARRPGGQQIPG